MSTCLDTLRIFAALAVFLGHTNFQWFFGSSLIGPQNGQDYVIIFFVLSGFVIAWSVDKKKDLSFSQYIFDRLTRLWSVVLPSLLIGYVLDYFGNLLHPSSYGSILASNHTEAKFLASSLFLHESWFFSIRPGTNGPFWSLSYEFFYYMIFGSIMLLPRLEQKLLGGLAWGLLAGPKVLLLFPCWLIGWFGYRVCKSWRLPIYIALPMVLSSSIFLICRMLERWSNWDPWSYPGLGVPPLFYSAKFIDDYITAAAVGLWLVSIHRWFGLEKKTSGWGANIIKKMANCSFSLYAIHFPAMAFLGALWTTGKLTDLNIFAGIIVILLFSYLFALVFEHPLRMYRQLLLQYIPILKRKCGIRC